MQNKTLAVILNHNRREYTDRLYKLLEPYQSVGGYELCVLDNGSTDEDEKSPYTTHNVDTNVYYGGAVNVIYKWVLDTPQYDSVLILNNDIILHPYSFVSRLRYIMWVEGYHVVSPSVLQPETNQCYWNQMHNYGHTSTRSVKWVDFMCPLIRREVVDIIQQYHHDLLYGWGQDVYTGMVCEEHGWKTGVTDTLSVIHLAGQTYKDGKSDISSSEYGQRAMQGMTNFFNKIQKFEQLKEYREWGRAYRA